MFLSKGRTPEADSLNIEMWGQGGLDRTVKFGGKGDLTVQSPYIHRAVTVWETKHFIMRDKKGTVAYACMLFIVHGNILCLQNGDVTVTVRSMYGDCTVTVRWLCPATVRPREGLEFISKTSTCFAHMARSSSGFASQIRGGLWRAVVVVVVVVVGGFVGGCWWFC